MISDSQIFHEAIAEPSYGISQARGGLGVASQQDLAQPTKMPTQSIGEALNEMLLKNPALEDTLFRNLTEWRQPTRAVLPPKHLDTRNIQETSEEFKSLIGRNIFLRYRDYANLEARRWELSLGAQKELAGVTWKELEEQLIRESDARKRWEYTPLGTMPPNDIYTQFVNSMAQKLRIPFEYAVSYIREFASRDAHNGIDVDIQTNDLSRIAYSIIRDESCLLNRVFLSDLGESQGRIMDAMKRFEERYFEALQRVKISPYSSFCKPGKYFLSEEAVVEKEQETSEHQRVEVCDGRVRKSRDEFLKDESLYSSDTN